MAIFDSTKKQYLNVFVHLTDAARVASLQASFPNGEVRSPLDDPGVFGGLLSRNGIADEYAAPFQGATEPAASMAPFSWSPWAATTVDGHPFPLNRRSFSRHTGGFFGVGGTTVEYRWVAQFVLASDPDVAPNGGSVADEADIPSRRWIEGFEMPALGPSANGLASSGLTVSRDASRHVGGLGLAFRGATSTSITNAVNLYSAITPKTSWERFYVRLRELPDVATIIWRWNAAPSSGNGQAIAVTTDGSLVVYNSSNVLVYTLNGVIDTTLVKWDGTSTHNVWKRIDILLSVDPAGDQTAAGTMRVYVDGVAKGTFTAMTGVASHASSTIGNPVANVNTLELDYDDWINAAVPVRGAAEALTGKDFLNGSKITLVRPNTFAATHNAVAWTGGDVRTLLQNGMGVDRGATQGTLASTTASTIVAATTDSAGTLDADKGSLGIAAINIGVMSKRGTTSGHLGYSLNAGAATFVSIVEAAALGGQSILVNNPTTTVGTGQPVAPDVTPLEIYYRKGADVTSGQVTSLLSQVEMYGNWGPEDYQQTKLAGITIEPAGAMGVHNAPYPRSPWGRRGVQPPISPYVVQGGTYTGNSSGQDLTFRSPVAWFIVRPLTSGAGGYQWWSSMLTSHKANEIGLFPSACNADEDPTFTPVLDPAEGQQQRYRVRIAGSDTQINATGVTYQYIAVMDPGGRFCLNGTFNAKASGITRNRKIIDPDFTPGLLFLQGEEISATTTVRFYGKGSGNAAATIVNFTPATVASALTMTAGNLETQSALHALARTWAYSAWRRADGNNDTGQAAAVCFGTYTGDGSASRTINFAPATGKRPLFALVFAESAGSGMTRDPSNTGTTSQTHTGAANASTGITAGGIDSMTVGSVLNTNAVIFHYFVLFADATAGNGGWGTNGEFTPVEPVAVVGGQWPDPVEPADIDDDDDSGEGDGDDQPDQGPPDLGTNLDFIGVCGQWGTYLANVALSRIGISKSLSALATDVSEAAYMTRLHFILDMDTTLRDYPWSFATRYANLVLVDGSEEDPVNKDWTYSYRAPTNMIFARRIVGQAGQKRAHDPAPPNFALGSDATGKLIYTNVAIATDVPVQLEYTYRVPCPASVGDELFRNAFAWKLAASLALPLARDSKKATDCELMYRDTLALARTVDAQEVQGEPQADADYITGRN